LAGNFVSKFGSSGSGDGQFQSTNGIAVTSTHIYVTDGNNRIQIFDLGGNFVTKFGSSGPGDGRFQTPWGIIVNGTHLLVSDRTNFRVQIFLLTNFPPRQVLAQAGSGNISLSWLEPMDNATYPVLSYRIYRGQQSGILTNLDETLNSYYNDSSVIDAQTYYYAVTAVTSSGESMLSDEVSASIPPSNITTETIIVTETVTVNVTNTQTNIITEIDTITETVSETTTETAIVTDTETQVQTIEQSTTLTQTVEYTSTITATINPSSKDTDVRLGDPMILIPIITSLITLQYLMKIRRSSKK